MKQVIGVFLMVCAFGVQHGLAQSNGLAMKTYRSIIQKDSLHYGAVHNLGNCFVQKGQLDSAAIYYKRALLIYDRVNADSSGTLERHQLEFNLRLILSRLPQKERQRYSSLLQEGKKISKSATTKGDPVQNGNEMQLFWFE